MKVISSIGDIKKIIIIMTFSIVSSCSPTVSVKTPEKPIEINLNVKIQHNVKVRIDKDLDNLIENSSNLF